MGVVQVLVGSAPWTQFWSSRSVFFTYFLFCSGIIYDVITETPSIGSEKDPRTGAVKPVAVMAGRINSQFIIEGLTASVLFCLGGIGIMLLDQAAAKDVSVTNRTILLGIAGLCLFIAYNVLGVFIRL